MAKQSGLGMTCAIDDSGGTPKTIENDITNLSFDTPQALQDITGLDKSGNERLGLLRDFTVSITGVFNTTADAIHDVFKVTTGTRTVTIIQADTLATECLVGSVSWTRPADGSFGVSADLANQNGAIPAWS